MTLSEILAKHGINNSELLADIEGEFASAATKNTGGIPKNRFDEVIGQRNEANARISELEAELNQHKELVGKHAERIKTLEPLEAEIKSIREQEFTKNKDTWTQKIKAFDTKEGDARHLKVQAAKESGDFAFAKDGEELTPEQIQQNLKAYGVYERAGVFEAPAAAGAGGHEPPPAGSEKAKPDSFDKLFARS